MTKPCYALTPYTPVHNSGRLLSSWRSPFFGRLKDLLMLETYFEKKPSQKPFKILTIGEFWHAFCGMKDIAYAYKNELWALTHYKLSIHPLRFAAFSAFTFCQSGCLQRLWTWCQKPHLDRRVAELISQEDDCDRAFNGNAWRSCGRYRVALHGPKKKARPMDAPFCF